MTPARWPSAGGERSISHGSVGWTTRGRFASHGTVIPPEVAAGSVLREIDLECCGRSPEDRVRGRSPGDFPHRFHGNEAPTGRIVGNEALNGRTLDPSGNERRTLEPSGNGASHGRTVREHGVARTDRPGTGHRAAGRSGLSPARRRPRSWRRSASALCGRQSGLRPARRPSRSLRWRVRRSRGSRRRRAARGWPRVRGSHGAPRRGGYGVAR